jgi:AraC-like DNA-binding protein
MSPDCHQTVTLFQDDVLIMKRPGHLTLNEMLLPSSAEWVFDFGGWCFLRVSEGAGYAITGTPPKALAEGDVAVLGRSAEVTFRASQLADWRMQYFRLCPQLLSGFFTFSEQHYLETAALPADRIVRFFVSDSRVGREFAELVAHRQTENYLFLRCEMLHIVASVLADELTLTPPQNRQGADAGQRFEQLVEDLPAAEIENRTLSELASLCCCSERHVSRLFRKHFGFSMRSKQIEMRLQKAQQLVGESDIKINQIALDSGFNHLGLFHSMFKRRFGMTPSEWRALAAQKRFTSRTAHASSY